MDSKTTLPLRVAIIGAGSSGLAAIKACNEEGLEPTCYEKSDSIGGIWRYREDEASVAESTVTNTSKEMTGFSDFPPPKNYPNYLRHEQLLAYLEMYAERFDLRQYVRLRQEVVRVVPAEDYPTTGRWKVTINDIPSGKIHEDIFDGVMVCSGHFASPKAPSFPGMDLFRGEVLHTRHYRKPDSFAGKRVLVIGLGNSGGDVAVDMTRVAEQVFVSTRKGTWILSRTGVGDFPLDLMFNRRLMFLVARLLPFGVMSSLGERKANQQLDHAKFGLRPRHRILSQQPTVNEHLITKVAEGAVQVKRDVDRFTETGVVFLGEESVTPVDSVVFATGYNIVFPFLGEELIPVRDNHVTLYKYVFPPHLKHPTLATIGLVIPAGAVFPVSEIQSRWVAMVIRGKVKLPDQATMMKEILERRKRVSRRYVHSPRYSIQTEWIPYMDEIASLIGAVPNLPLLAVTDPKLFWECFCGPCFPYQYRIRGPHPWAGAREVILAWRERMESTSQTPPEKSRNIRAKIVPALCLVALVVLSYSGVYQLF